MATDTTNAKKGLTKVFDPDKVDMRKFRNKWSNKAEFDKVSAVRDRVEEQRLGRSTSCPYYNTRGTEADSDESEGHEGRTGSNWANKWDLDWKQWSMYSEDDSTRSNLKSPTVFAPTEALLAEFMENRLGMSITPTQEEDKEKVMVIDAAFSHWMNKSGVDAVNNDSMKTCAVTGSSTRAVLWQKVEREVELIQGSHEVTEELHRIKREGTKEEKAKADETINKDKKPLTKKKTIIEYDDVVHIPLSNYEVYWDDDARYVRSPAYEASDVTWRQTPSIEQFRYEFQFSKDPYVNKSVVDKVVPAKQSEAEYGDNPFFKAPGDLVSDNQVELLRYYNKATDKYLVIANDMIVRDGPLPYNHKELPFVLHRFIKWPNQFYGIGLAAVLLGNQTEDETLRNMMIEQAHLEINPPLFVTQNIYEDIDTGWDYVEPGQIVPMSGNPQTDVMWAPKSTYKPDYAILRQGLDSDAVKISGINPMAYAMPRPGEPVRNNMMSLESSLKMIKKGIRTYAEGYREAVIQTIKLFQQFYSDSYVEEIDKATNKTTKSYRVIKTPGIQWSSEAVIDPNTGELVMEGEDVKMELVEEKLSPGDDGFFELRDEYLALDGDVDIEIDVDTIVPISQGLKLQNSEKNLMKYVQILSNPELMANSAVVSLLRHDMQLNGVSSEVIDSLQDESDNEDEERADEQNQKMLDGKEVPPVPGESEAHLGIHQKAMSELIANKGQIVQELMMNPLTPTGQLITIEDALGIISNHLQGDAIDKQMAVDYTLSQGAPQMPPQGMGQPQMGNMSPEGGMMAPMGPEGAMGPMGGGQAMPPAGPGVI